MKILAIETSCDETAIAIIDYDKPRRLKGSRLRPKASEKTGRVEVLANLVSSQIEIHKPFGGVVPNLARREHQQNLVPILISALDKAHLLKSGTSPSGKRDKKLEKILERERELFLQFKKEILPLKSPNIDSIAVTYGPGLAPALWVGVNFAKALSYIWKKHLIPVNHMEGHIFSALLKKYGNYKLQAPNSKQIPNSKFQILKPKLPALALLVSGGHTELVLMNKPGKYKIVGETIDDAAGEAFDKTARLLDLPYPGGPQISALAEISRTNANTKIADKRGSSQRESALESKGLRKSAFTLPRPMLYSKDFNFSFSGLKTAVLYLTRDLSAKGGSASGGKESLSEEVKAAIAKEFQDAVVEVLITKTMQAAEKYNVKTVILGGGVAANEELRKQLSVKCRTLGVEYLLPMLSGTGDNALMIALAAAVTGKKKAPNKVGAEGNLRL